MPSRKPTSPSKYRRMHREMANRKQRDKPQVTTFGEHVQKLAGLLENASKGKRGKLQGDLERLLAQKTRENPALQKELEDLKTLSLEEFRAFAPQVLYNAFKG